MSFLFRVFANEIMAGTRDRRSRSRTNGGSRSGNRDVESEGSASSVPNRAPAGSQGHGAAPPAPPPPDAQQLMQTFLAGIAQITAQATAGVGQHNPVPTDPFLIALREFERHRTQRFDGSGGYAAAEEWIGAVEQTFRLSRTPEGHKSELASTLLEKDARHWWATQEPQLAGGVQGTTWTRTRGSGPCTCCSWGRG